ncbi:MAG: sugar phosphate isomerase/epimerase, partial [Spirochaetales bacterium]|nr:sugar phosphate isomerase/epimerase [Spirochaetales bacterium]
EYTPSPEGLGDLPRHVDPFLERGLPVRCHGFFPGYELGDPDPELAERALDLHRRTLEAMEGHGEAVITLHAGLDPALQIQPQRLVENLSRVVEQARRSGITVCLENLRRGPTSHPDTLIAWASEAGARITFDAGHAISSRHAASGECTALDYLDRVADHVHEAHMYGKEENDRHYPIRRAEDFQPIVDRLTKSECRWWTIELDDYREALDTRAVLLECLRTAKGR